VYACLPLPPTPAGLAAAGAMLRAGRCVGFPTETVYGLGANALSEAAVLNIFAFKGRPLTDPLIVHVPDAAAAGALVLLPPPARRVFDALAAAFWPGPLTLVARAVPEIPLKVTAGTGFVGVRVPHHPLAQALLRAAGVPVAAPSANRFGHVSPTRASHVIADLGAHAIGVLMGEGYVPARAAGAAAGAVGGAGGQRAAPLRFAVSAELSPYAATAGVGADGDACAATDGASGADNVGGVLELEDVGAAAQAAAAGAPTGGDASCAVGIESTVAKVEVQLPPGAESGHAVSGSGSGSSGSGVRLVVFRRGGVSVQALRAALDAAGMPDVPVVVQTQHQPARLPRQLRRPSRAAMRRVPPPPAWQQQHPRMLLAQTPMTRRLRRLAPRPPACC
jgi:tRNA threonylcarbamoyl adenosine modification protein (Sua5/YciO/YrdC/YwlC family)